MKTPILLMAVLLVLLISGCDFDIFPDPEPPPPPVLPPITQTGENTLGFLLDGEVWVPNRIFQAQYRKSDGRFGISCINDSYDEQGNKIGQDFEIGARDVPIFSTGIYQIGNEGDISVRFFDYDKLCTYWSWEVLPGTLKITVLDTINRVISGIFELTTISSSCNDTLRITSGRFDVSF
ncbi:MAG: hypothetical protein SF053_05005 [Bacteroidia bacterium]|nr:hypothetical protein [Bacteroidia bacterium]